MKAEVDKHKWFESEKAGKDIGFTQAVIDWTLKFKNQWLISRKQNRAHCCALSCCEM